MYLKQIYLWVAISKWIAPGVLSCFICTLEPIINFFSLYLLRSIYYSWYLKKVLIAYPDASIKRFGVAQSGISRCRSSNQTGWKRFVSDWVVITKHMFIYPSQYQLLLPFIFRFGYFRMRFSAIFLPCYYYIKKF